MKTSTASVLYYNRLMAMTDVLASPVTLTSPANNATGVGYSESTISLVKSVDLAWEAKTGATSYALYVGTSDFKQTIAYITGTGKQATISSPNGSTVFAPLVPGETYAWMVKTIAPFESPWSEVRYFTVASAVMFNIQSPTNGATGVDIMPTFVWSPYEGAIGYEIMVAEDPTFAILDMSHSSSVPMYKAEEALAYGTTYYWRVRGVTGPAPPQQAAPGGPWATGIFTTMEEPPTETEPVVIVTTEPAPPPATVTQTLPGTVVQQAIPDYLLIIVIVIGAVLVITVIVLIVRTRRVT
jgi:hypothetical protein